MHKKQTSRRDFIGLGVAAAAISACSGCSIFGSRKPNAVIQEKAGKLYLSEENSKILLGSETSLLVKSKSTNDKIIVVHLANGDLYAVSSICTHMGCDVEYDKSLHHLRCPCHGSQYGLDGSNIKGPARKPLKSYDINIKNDRIVITL